MEKFHVFQDWSLRRNYKKKKIKELEKAEKQNDTKAWEGQKKKYGKQEGKKKRRKKRRK